jgi:uncharacterized membrane protein YfcA
MELFFKTYSVQVVIELSILFLGSALINGLTGFGFGLIGTFSLFFLAPSEAIPLLMMMSVFVQTLNIATLKENIQPLNNWWSMGPSPYILGGLIGVPIGLQLLLTIHSLAFDVWIGLFLMMYSVVFLIWKKKHALTIFSIKSRVLTGFLGGIFGGFSAIPAFPLLVYGKISGWDKNFQRSIIQPFIWILQVGSLIDFFIRGKAIHFEFLILSGLMIVPVLIGNRIGIHFFQKINESKFQKVVLLILFFSGISLIFKGKTFILDLFHHNYIDQHH